MAAAAPAARPASSGSVARTGLELLLFAYTDHLLSEPGEGIEARQAVLEKLEALGYNVGRRMAERLMLMQYELPAGTEKAMQIVCTRLWRELHGRNASRLKRLKQDGGYIIEDNHFRLFASLAAPGGVDVRDVAGKYVMFTRGAVRGALVALGVSAAVHADWTKDFPGVRFRVQLDQTMFSGAV